jgi:RNA polymerase sigma-70 factor (ECF subfamily)
VSRRVLPFRPVEGKPSEMSDEGLVKACAVGDGAALGALFDRHYESVRGFLARSSGTDDRDLDDLVQVTFAAVPRAARRFDSRAQVRTWLLGIATNVVRHHVRAEVRRKRLSGAVAASSRPTCVDAGAELLEHERAQRLQQAILELPEKLREPFLLVYLEGIPGREVAELLGVREGTIWKRLHQGRARLREALTGVEP